VLTDVRFELLGSVQMRLNENEIDVGSPQQRAVLALLLLNAGRQVSVDDVVEALWGSDVPMTAVGTARNYISRLRRIFASANQNVSGFGADISANRGGYQLTMNPNSLDVELFRRSLTAAREARKRSDLAGASRQLTYALSLWQGDALAGLHGSFFESRRAWLEQLRATALEEQWALDIELGSHTQAAAELAVAVAEQPYRERLWELLMWALYCDGRQTEAVSTYREVRRLLDRELGLEPGPGLRGMQARILAADPLLANSLSRGGPPGSVRWGACSEAS
jgi:DNA-binding SARP family transcriptional activator